MTRDKIIEKVLNDVSVDSRISNGIFDIQNNQHIGYLYEYLVNQGIEEDLVLEFAGTLMEKGNFPERQAYNAKGILVTFPTPEYKKAAIQAGTHFENDPTRGHPNVFATDDKPPATEPPPSSDNSVKTKLPVSTSTASPPPAEKSGEEPTEPAQQMPNAFTTAAPQQSPNSTEDQTEPTKLPAPQPTPSVEKQANKDVIKKMLRGDDYMLEQMVSWFVNNAPEYLLEQMDEHKKKYER